MKKTKKLVTIVLSLMMAVSVSGVAPVCESQAAAKTPVLEKKSGKLLIGTSGTVTIKNVKKKNVKKLTVVSSDKKIATAEAAGDGKKTAICITAVKAGKAKVTAQLKLKNKKKYKLVYKVTSATEISKKVPVFRETETKEKAELKFFAGMPNVAYMDIDDYYKLFFPTKEIKISQSGKDKNIFTLTSPTGTATVDVAKETFFSENYPAFTNLMSLVQEGMDNTYLDGVPYVRFDRTETLTAGSPVTFDFSRYDIDLRADGDGVYFPVVTLSDIYSDPCYHFAFYSGKKIYVEDENHLADPRTRDKDDYYDAVLDNLTKRKEQPDLTEFTYNELMFAIDHLYGNARSSTPLYPLLNEKKNAEDALDALEIDGQPWGKVTKNLLASPKGGDFILGMYMLDVALQDGGHTSVNVNASTFPDDVRTEKILEEKKQAEAGYSDLMKLLNDEVTKGYFMYTMVDGRKRLRNNLLGLDPVKAGNMIDKSKYAEKGDTAVCVLDIFNLGSPEDYHILDDYLKQPVGNRTLPDIPDGATTPVVQFLDALEKASSNPNIKNFVLDISNNPGGSGDEVLTIISLMKSDANAVFHGKNTLTGTRTNTHYKVDRNFDGVIDERDAAVDYTKRFKFAVLTSSYSFSCGNLFPELAKEAGITILGERSGGGACIVQKMTTANGLLCQISSFRCMLMDASGEKSIDDGVPVDVDLIPKNPDGSVKLVSMDAKDIKTKEEVTIQAPDYSALYDIDRLSAEINTWYGNKGM